ncbi:HD-GYP domain-containing protein [Marinobacterium aestuariivivens]|uniref:HD-GYP domain-containing protein n=1 Tax=Marinobacterium aestuariivivens TaxID=1698799 RepID=A0ABW2A4K2_9GAMM
MDSRYQGCPDQIEDFLESVFLRHGPDGVIDALSFLFGAFVLTMNGRLIAASESFAALVGYDITELRDMDVLQLVVPECRSELKRRLAADITARYELQLLSKNGAVKQVVVSPRLFHVQGRKYRLAEFIDQSGIYALQRHQLENFRNTACALTQAIEQRDPYTNGHMSRTTSISLKLAETLGLKGPVIDSIRLGASMHDIGKLAVPIEILTKPGKLVSHEWAFIKRHPEVGHSILASIDFDKTVKDIVLLHHERHDGSGYPYGLGGQEIPLEVSIVAAADCLEAIAGVRPYRKARSFQDAIAIMEQESPKYDREVLRAARSLVDGGELHGLEYNPEF